MTFPIKLRRDIQYSDISIIIDDPTVLYRATADALALDYDLWTIAFTPDAGSGAPAPGTLTDCLEDMTLLIGTAAGLGDISAVRLRRTSGGADTVFYIGADPSLVLNPLGGDFLTVIDDFELWAKHPNAALLDVDVAVGTAFTQFVPIPWFNGRYAVIDPGGTVNFNASRSWCPGNTISAYSWSAPGSTTSGAPSPGLFWAHYHTTGRYRVSLEVTATTTGKTFKGYGYVYVRGTGVDEITDVISLESIEGDADSGYVCSVELVDRPTILDRRRVIIFAEDYYGADASSFGPVYGRENILMVGWIDGETINRTPEKDTVTFEIGGPLSLMNSLSTQPAGIQDTSFPADEGQVPLSGWATQAGLTAAKVLQYMALYRSTIARFMDFSVEDWVFLSGKLTSEGDNLLSQVTDFAGKNALNVRADRIGRVFVERDTQLYPVASRTANIPTACTLLDTDIQGELNIIRRQHGAAAMATAEGTIYFLAIVTQVGGRSPGDQPAQCGSIYSLNDLSVSTQGDVLELSGLIAGCKNQEIEMITAVLAENNRLMDIAPRMFVEVTVDGTLLRCIPRMVRYERNPETGFMHTELDLEPEGSEWPSVTILYPDEGEPPVKRRPEPPEPPEPPEKPLVPPEEPGDLDAVVATAYQKIWSTEDLDELDPLVGPTWSEETDQSAIGPGWGSNDSDLAWWNRDIMVAIGAYHTDEEKLYLTQNLTAAGKATWTDITPAFTERSNLFFGRVKFAPTIENKIFAIGYAAGTMPDTLSCWIFISANLGLTWNYHLVRDDFNGLIGNYIVTQAKESITQSGTVQFDMEHRRTGDSDSTINPWACAWQLTAPAASGGWNALVGSATTIHDFSESGTDYATPILGNGNDLLGGGGLAGEAYMDDYFGVGGWVHAGGINRNMPKETARILMRPSMGHMAGGTWETVAESWVFWNVPQLVISYAFDIARNNMTLYVGFIDNIYRSLDAGYTWQPMDLLNSFGNAEGAYDIQVDPLIYGAIYYWSAQVADTHLFKSPTLGIPTPSMHTSKLYLCVAGIKQATEFDKSWPTNAVYRIARSWNSGKMWTVRHYLAQWEINLWNLGSITTQLGSAFDVPYLALRPSDNIIKGSTATLGNALADGFALKYYHQDKLIFVCKRHLRISDDAGTTWLPKKGLWTHYSWGVVGHRLPLP